MRVGICKIDLSSPDTSVVVLIVLSLDVLSFVLFVPPIGKIAAYSAYDMFSWYKYLIVNLVFPPRFKEWESLSDCAFS